MKRVLVVLVIMTTCASLISSMALKKKRDLNTVEGGVSNTNGGASNNNQQICAESTPCAWSTYNEHTKAIMSNITNTYCVCGPGTDCYVDADDQVVFSYVYHCRKPLPDGDKNSVSERNS